VWHTTCKGKPVSCVKKAVQQCQEENKKAAAPEAQAEVRVCDTACQNACDEPAVKNSGGMPSRVLEEMNKCMLENAK